MRGQQPRAGDDIDLLFLLQRRKFQIQQPPLIRPMLKPTWLVALATERSLPSVVSCPTLPASVASARFHFTPAHAGFFINGHNMRRQLDLLDGNIHLAAQRCSVSTTAWLSRISRRLVRLSTDKLPFGLRSFSAAFCSSPASA
jgi:hypothetical protein